MRLCTVEGCGTALQVHDGAITGRGDGDDLRTRALALAYRLNAAAIVDELLAELDRVTAERDDLRTDNTELTSKLLDQHAENDDVTVERDEARGHIKSLRGAALRLLAEITCKDAEIERLRDLAAGA